MKKEDIEKAAEECAERIANIAYSGGGNIGQDDLERAFECGAQWRINSIWHDIEESPKQGSLIAVFDGEDMHLWRAEDIVYVINGIRVVSIILKECFIRQHIIKWAYIKDLITNKDNLYEKVKATGKVVEVQKIIEYLEKPGTSFGGDYEYYIDEANKKTYEETELDFRNVFPDWQQVRIQAAISAMNGLLTGTCADRYTLRIRPEQIAKDANEYADALIKELQKEINIENENEKK